MIQLFFIVNYNINNPSNSSGFDTSLMLVLFSLLWSVWSIVSKKVADDRIIFKSTFATLKLRGICDMNVYYILRVFWRLMDITLRIFIMCLIWLLMGGFTVGFIICVEFLFLIALSIYYNSFTFMEGLISTVVAHGTYQARFWSNFITMYRFITNFSFLILIFCFNYYVDEIGDSCTLCNSYEARVSYSTNNWVVGLFYYSLVAGILSPMIFKFVLYNNIEPRSSERNLKDLIASCDINGIRELQHFGWLIYDVTKSEEERQREKDNVLTQNQGNQQALNVGDEKELLRFFFEFIVNNPV